MAILGDNSKTEQELYEEQQFLKGYTEIKSLTSEMAGTKADIGAVHKRLKDLGWSKKDIEFAASLEDKDVGQVISDFERKIRIARMFGHALGRQLELLDDKAPQEDKAYDQGLAAGKLRKTDALNPYVTGTPEWNRWATGHAEGSEFINRELAAILSDEQPD